MTDPDTDDEFESEAKEEPAPCPYCGSGDECDHQILFWSGCGGDWSGRLAEATRKTKADLCHALWQALLLKNTHISEHTWPGPLARLIREASTFGLDSDDPENCDWSGPMRDYWEELWYLRADCTEDRWTFEDGGPGCSDRFGVLYAENPSVTIEELKATAEKHVALLRDWSSSRAVKPS